MSGNVRGVCILALGSPYYGSWAFNLCMGLKQTDPKTNVCLLWQGDAKQFIEPYIANFDSVIEVPKGCTLRNGFPSLLRAKTCVYDLSPYDETIVIDADVIWFPFKPISNIFDELKDIEFTIGNRGECDLSTDPRLIWSDLNSMKAKFGENAKVYNLSSEFMYFKKTDKVREFFDLSQEIFDNPEVDYVRFAGGVPDELAFQIAMIKTGLKPHQNNYLPFYWEAYHKGNKNLSDLYKEPYYGYSVGGAVISPTQKHNYDTLAKVYANGFGVKHPFLAYSKRDLFNNRKNI